MTHIPLLKAAPTPVDRRIADFVAALFALVIVLYAASAPLAEAVQWIVVQATRRL